MSTTAATSTPAVAPAATPAATGTTASPIREAQVQTAVTFLTNPRVIGSPISRRVSFLEGKGLSASEIAEALRRTQPDSPEHVAVRKGIKLGKSASESVAGLDSSSPSSSTSSTTTAAPAPAAPVATSTTSQQYTYSAPPGYVAGPPAYQGGPPVLYPISAAPAAAAPPAPSSGSSWRTIAYTTAGVLGSVMAAGYVAKRALGLEVSRPSGPAGDEPSSNDALAQPTLPNPTATAANSTAQDALVPRKSKSARSHFGGLGDDDESEEEEDDDDDSNEEKYLSAWLGHDQQPTTNGKKSRRSKHGTSSSALAYELRSLSGQLETLVDSMRDQQMELRKVASKLGSSSNGAYDGISNGSGGISNARVESLLTTSIQTQNEMLATLKIMMAGQARAWKEGSGSGAAIGLAAPSPSSATASSADQQAPFGKSWIEQNLNGVTAAPATAGGTDLSALSHPNTSTAGPPHPSSSFPDYMRTSPLATAPSSTALTAPSPSSSSDPLIEGRRQLEDCLQSMRVSNSSDVLRACCNAMLLYIQNLVDNMSQPRYRRILMSNSSYVSRVKNTIGAEKFMLAAGFEIKAPYLEWNLPSSSAEGMDGMMSTTPGDRATATTGTGLVMDEQQKIKQMQEALNMLKQFKQQLENEGSNNNAVATNHVPPPSQPTPGLYGSGGSGSGAGSNTQMPSTSSPFNGNSYQASQMQQQQPQTQTGTGGQLSTNLTQAAPTYPHTAQPTSVQPQQQPQFQPQSQSMQAQQQPSSYQQAWQQYQQQKPSYNSQPNLQQPQTQQPMPQQQGQQQSLNPSTMMQQQQQPQQTAPWQSSSPSQSFSYPNTPMQAPQQPQQHPMSMSAMVGGGGGGMNQTAGFMPNGIAHSYPNTPMPPPAFQPTNANIPYQQQPQSQPAYGQQQQGTQPTAAIQGADIAATSQTQPSMQQGTAQSVAQQQPQLHQQPLSEPTNHTQSQQQQQQQQKQQQPPPSHFGSPQLTSTSPFMTTNGNAGAEAANGNNINAYAPSSDGNAADQQPMKSPAANDSQQTILTSPTET